MNKFELTIKKVNRNLEEKESMKEAINDNVAKNLL